MQTKKRSIALFHTIMPDTTKKRNKASTLSCWWLRHALTLPLSPWRYSLILKTGKKSRDAVMEAITPLLHISPTWWSKQQEALGGSSGTLQANYVWRWHQTQWRSYSYSSTRTSCRHTFDHINHVGAATATLVWYAHPAGERHLITSITMAQIQPTKSS
jgi:hypothetical protein